MKFLSTPGFVPAAALLTGAVGLLGAAGMAHAQAFTAGNVVVSQIGNGTEALKSPDLTQDLTANIYLDQYTPGGTQVSQLALSNLASGANHGIVTSGGSKSEGALSLSVDGRYLSYIGYDTAGQPNNGIGNPDVSKLPNMYNRVVARIGADGSINTTTALTDAYQGDNPRAAVSVDGTQFYTAGNADKKAIKTLGARYTTLGSSTSTLLGTVTGTPSKADNIRGIGIYNGNLYVSKGSGGNGANGIFQVGTGLPTTGGNTVTELPGFPTTNPNGSASGFYPFGFFFANPTTLYVADEGLEQSDPTPTDNAGLQKYTFAGGTWNLDYILKNGLNLGQAVTLSGVTSYTEGLRSLAGRVNTNGTVSFYSITAQTDANINNGDADPDQLVTITDSLAATTLPVGETFTTVAVSPANTVFRGVAFAPSPVPEASSAVGLGIGLAGMLGFLAVGRRSGRRQA